MEVKHFKFLLFSSFLSLATHAQVKLGIGTELPGKIAVAVDSFWVASTTPAKAIGVALPGLKAQLQVAYLVGEDTTWLNRTVDLPESGTYYYALVQIPTGALRLRLRSSAPWTSNLAFVSPEKKQRVGELPILLAAEPELPPALKPEPTSVKATSPPPDSVLVASLTQQPASPKAKDSLLVAPSTPPTPTAPATTTQTDGPSPYFLALAELKSTQFEFERIQKASALASSQSLSTDQLLEVLATFRFDQSKLEVIKRLPQAYKKQVDWEKIKALLEFQTSKNLLDQWIQQTP